MSLHCWAPEPIHSLPLDDTLFSRWAGAVGKAGPCCGLGATPGLLSTQNHPPSLPFIFWEISGQDLTDFFLKWHIPRETAS